MLRLIGSLLFFLPWLGLAQQSDTLHFIWTDDTINGVYVEKSAMFIPVQLENDTSTYYFQFDTGANTSSLYTKDQPKFESAANQLRTSLGELTFEPLDDMSPYTEKGMHVIGTIGANILQDRILEIDFPEELMIISQSTDLSCYELYDIQSSYGRPAITIDMGMETLTYLFDTGSSLFQLWTTKKVWKKYSQHNGETSEMTISSWGNESTVYTSKIDELTLVFPNQQKIHIDQITYSSNKNYKKTFHAAGVDGIIGNQPFLESSIVIDMSNQKFGVRTCH